VTDLCIQSVNQCTDTLKFIITVFKKASAMLVLQDDYFEP